MAEEKKVTLQNKTGDTVYRPETDADKVTVTDGSTVQDVLDSLKSQVAILRKAVGSCLVFETIADRNAMKLDAAGYTAFVRDATGDPTVPSGGAFYIASSLDDSGAVWAKIGPASVADLDNGMATDAELAAKGDELKSQIDTIDAENDARAATMEEHLKEFNETEASDYASEFTKASN